jgi:hypothetical protein
MKRSTQQMMYQTDVYLIIYNNFSVFFKNIQLT